jgi:nucleolar protein 4
VVVISNQCSSSTLFVSNLPYTATSVDLETLFSDIAPVRTAFVVTEQGSGVSKGVGYVSFALKEDAETCFKQVSEEGLAIAGRKIRVQWADKKVRSGIFPVYLACIDAFPIQKRKEEGSTVEKKEIKSRPREPVTRIPHDPLAVRIVIVSGLPSPLDSKTLWKKIRKCTGAETLTWPVKTANDSEDPSLAHVVFKTPSQASDAVTKLHAHVYKGSLLSVTLKKRLEVLAKPVPTKKTAAASSTPASVAPNRASRLIVRNLPFNATEQDLRALFLPYGPVHSITMPKPDAEAEEKEKKEGEEGKGTDRPPMQNRGFAFVWMLSKKDAEKALEGCNGKTIRAGLAQELVSSKQKKKKQLRLEKKIKGMSVTEGDAEPTGEGEGEGEGEKEEMEVVEEGEVKEEHKNATERVIAVDWALSKEKWKEEKAKIEEAAAEDSDVEMESSSKSGMESEGSGSGSDDEDEDEGLGVHEDSDDEEDGSSQDGLSDFEYDRDSGDEEEPTKPQLPAPEAGTTLFVRNVPYVATEDELRALFRAFGPLRYARITMDPETGRSRGTGFACFWNKEDADKVLEQAEILRSETGLGSAAVRTQYF